MTKKYNQVSFSKSDVEKGLHLRLIDNLVKYNIESDGQMYNDIHVDFDGETTTVEWTEVFIDEKECEPRFRFVDLDEAVVYTGLFPDNHYEYFDSKEDFDEALANFLDAHPDYEKNEFGRWIEK